jgi:hypothetical protein
VTDTEKLKQIAGGDCLSIPCVGCPVIQQCIQGHSEHNAQLARRMLQDTVEELSDYELSRIHDRDLERRKQEIFDRLKERKR